jgi:D-3-phosphoglycerate dehydrogenase
MSKFRVAMTDNDYGEEALDIQRRIYSEIDADFQVARCKSEDQALEWLRDADIVVNEHFSPINRRIIQSLERCKAIIRTGVGVESIDVDAATEFGIAVINIPAYCVDEVSDHTLALILALARHLKRLDLSVSEGTWDFKSAGETLRLRGRTLGLLGFGKIARRLVPKAKVLGLQVIACDPYVDPNLIYACQVQPVSFDQLLKGSDFISIHCPLTHETWGIFDESAFRAMKEGTVIVNTSRGAIIKTRALIQALDCGWIAGAGIDTLEGEPPGSDHPLYSYHNVILTPHFAWHSREALIELHTTMAEEGCRVLTGRRPLSCVNPQVLDGLGLG